VVLNAERPHVKTIAGRVTLPEVALPVAWPPRFVYHIHAIFVKDSGMLTLSEAVKSGRLQEFIAQEEARGIGSIERSELDRTLAAMLKAP
jgi:hypothetical protein